MMNQRDIITNICKYIDKLKDIKECRKVSKLFNNELSKKIRLNIKDKESLRRFLDGIGKWTAKNITINAAALEDTLRSTKCRGISLGDIDTLEIIGPLNTVEKIFSQGIAANSFHCDMSQIIVSPFILYKFLSLKHIYLHTNGKEKWHIILEYLKILTYRKINITIITARGCFEEVKKHVAEIDTIKVEEEKEKKKEGDLPLQVYSPPKSFIDSIIEKYSETHMMIPKQISQIKTLRR